MLPFFSQTPRPRLLARCLAVGATSLILVMASIPVFAAGPHPPEFPPTFGRIVSPVPGSYNVQPTTPVTFTLRPPISPANVPPNPNPKSASAAGRPPGPKVKHVVVAVSNAAGTTLFTMSDPTVVVHRATDSVTWTPTSQTVAGTTQTLLGRYAEDSVALVRGPLPGLSGKTRKALMQAGTVTLPGMGLAALVVPPAPKVGKFGRLFAHPLRPTLLRGEVANINGNTVDLFGGPSVVIPKEARIRVPGVQWATLANVHLGDLVQITLPPAGHAPGQSPVVNSQRKGPRLHLTVLPAPNLVDTVFTTGSAVGEPVQWAASLATVTPSVFTGDPLTVTAQDSYGDPATTGRFTVIGTAPTSRLSSTFRAPAGTITAGQGTSAIGDHTAQTVSLTVHTAGPYPGRDRQTMAVGTVAFQPGPPATMTLTAGAALAAGQTELANGVVTDRYGNPVLPSAIDLSASAGSLQSPVTTTAGIGTFTSPFHAPTTLSSAPGLGESVTLWGASQHGSATATTSVRVNPGPVAKLSLKVPSTVQTGQAATITGTAQDAYGNPVLNGTVIDLTASAGSIDATVTTQNGQFQATYHAPTQPGSVVLHEVANGVQQTATIQVMDPTPAPLIVPNPSPAGTWSSPFGVGTTPNEWEWKQHVTATLAANGPFNGLWQASGIQGTGMVEASAAVPAGTTVSAVYWNGYLYNGLSRQFAPEIVAEISTAHGLTQQVVWTMPTASGMVHVTTPTAIALPADTVGVLLVGQVQNANWPAASWEWLLNTPMMREGNGQTVPMFPRAPTPSNTSSGSSASGSSGASGSSSSPSPGVQAWTQDLAALGYSPVPKGTIATASSGNPSAAIDGNLATEWNAETHTATITLMFPRALTAYSVLLAMSAFPTSSEQIRVQALKSGVWHNVGATSGTIAYTSNAIPPIGNMLSTLAGGAGVQGLRITVTSSGIPTASPVEVHEIGLLE